MGNIATVRQKLSELEVLKSNRDKLSSEKKSIPNPTSSISLIQAKRYELNSYSDEALGVDVKCEEEPQKKSFVPPRHAPAKKTANHYNYNIILMLRPVVFAIVMLITFLTKNVTLFTIYLSAWLIVWIVFGYMKDKKSFSFKGFWLGFVHIFNLYKLPAYFSEKKTAEKYNSNVYPKLYEEYEKEYNEAKIAFEKESAEYEKEYAKYTENVKKRNDERKASIDKLISEYTKEANEIAEKSKKEYDEKVKSIDLQIAEIDKKIKPYSKIDESIMFDPNAYSAADIGKIVAVIDKGRASSLKEAINVYLDDQRKEDEEWQRQKEAEEMARIAEYEADQRAAEIKRHNREMEYQAEQTAKQAKKEQEVLFGMQKAQALNEARRLCQSCIYKGSCHHVILGDPPINCTKYRGNRT